MAPTVPPAALLPTPLSAYPPPSPDGLLATLAQRASPGSRSISSRPPSSSWPSRTRSLVARFSALAHRVQHEADDAGGPGGASAAAQPEGRVPPLLRRSRGGLRSLGRRAGGGHPGVARLRHGHQLLRRYGQLHRADLRGRDHGARVDGAGGRTCRGRAAAGGRPRPGDAGGLVADDPDRRPRAGIPHHRARRHDHLRAAARTADLRAPAQHASEVRHASACSS